LDYNCQHSSKHHQSLKDVSPDYGFYASL
jgi:hypothetical protein